MKILYITNVLNDGGIEKLLYNYCSHFNNEIKFDIVILTKEKGLLEDDFKKLGCNIFRIQKIRDSFIGHCKELYEIIEKDNYDIVHDNSGYKGYYNMYVAYLAGVKIRIEHSHSAFEPETFISFIYRKIATGITKHFSTTLFACGKDAGEWMWGKDRKFYLIPNAIEVQKYYFSSTLRNKIRKELNIDNKIVIGNVARLSNQKNQTFLLDIFCEIHKIYKNSVLFLVGNGENKKKIENIIDTFNLNDCVFMFGERKDVNELLNAMDYFFLPSLFEGLPVSLIESQTNGLYSFVSDTITKEILITDRIIYLPLIKEKWLEKFVEIEENKSSKNRRKKNVKNTMYDIHKSSKDLQKIYKQIIENNNTIK